MTEISRTMDHEREAPILPGLQIARIISPLDSNSKLPEIFGIPFETHQLQTCSFNTGDQKINLLDLMNEFDLIGETQGVPHLSVGGGVQRPGASTHTYLQTNITRSYLVGGGLGVKGAGLIDYDATLGNQGFGIGEFISRTSGVDIAGGLEQWDARNQEEISNTLYALSYLQNGTSSFARIYKPFKFTGHQLYSLTKKRMTESHFLVRDDGKRGMSKKELSKSLSRVLPLLTDFAYSPNDFFEPDGHNAFKRNGSVIFTDYEACWEMRMEYPTYISELKDAWFMEGLRKDFNRFAQMFSFSTTYTPINYSLIQSLLYDAIKQSDYFDEGKQELIKDLTSGDKKGLIRQAMAGAICSRARAKAIGHEILRNEINTVLNANDGVQFTFEEMYTRLSKIDRENMISTPTGKNEECRILTDDDEGLEFELEIETFGLPIDYTVRTPITLADIYYCWPTEDKEELKDALLPENPFSDVPEDIISNSVYANIVSVFLNIKGLKHPNTAPAEQRFQGYDLDLLNEGRVLFQANNRFATPNINFSYNNLVNIRFEDGKLFIESGTTLGELSMTELNKLAYMVNTFLIYLKENPSSEIDNVELNLDDTPPTH